MMREPRVRVRPPVDGRTRRTAGPFSCHLDDDLARGVTPLDGGEGGRGVGERMDRGDHGCEESVKSQPSRPLQVLAVDATLDEASTEIGHGHVTHSADAAGIPDQPIDLPHRGTFIQVADHADTITNLPVTHGYYVLCHVVPLTLTTRYHQLWPR